MPTRADIVRVALSQNGYHNGEGYDERCKFSQSLLGPAYGAYGEGGTGPNDSPVLAYCDIFVSWVFEQVGLPLPKMGGWIRSGSQYCPESWAYADARRATRASYLASPGDQVIFDWTGTGVLGGESHTEIVERWANGVLYTVGGNSGPSNVDGYTGTGGVHRHAWSCPAGVGNDLIMGVIDTSKLVTFSDAPKPEPPVSVPMPALPIIDPGRDVGHPEMVALIRAVMTLANPKLDISTPAKFSAGVREWQKVLFNGWQTPPHGPSPQKVTGVMDMATFAGILRAAGARK